LSFLYRVDILERYEFNENKDLIGEGLTSKVYRCTRLKDEKEFAIKIIDKSILNNIQTKLVRNGELSVLKILNHPYVIKSYE